jgi:ribonuclease Y
LRWKQRSRLAALELKERTMLESAQRQAEAITREARLQANEDSLRLRQETENAFAARRQELGEAEKRLAERESLINRQLQSLLREEESLREQHQSCDRKAGELDAQRQELLLLAKQRRQELAAICKSTESEARAQFLKEIEMESLQDASLLTRRILDEAKARAEEKARRIISLAIQRYAGEHTFEVTSSTIALPNEELKGRIIGREDATFARSKRPPESPC